jgi:hypothetical protein
MEKPTLPVGVVMQRRAVKNRWVDCVWEPVQVVTGADALGSEPRALEADASVAQWLHPGLAIVLHRDEAEGYYLNCSGTLPQVFVLWRMEQDRGLPVEVTASSEEAGRWMDGGHSIDGVPMTEEIFTWVGEYVEKNYKPEPKQRIKPRSFRHPKDRV